MSIPLTSATPHAHDRLEDAGRDLRPAIARAVAANALLLGLTADSLFRDSPIGIAFPLWVAILALSAAALIRRADRRVSNETGAWLIGALVFSCGLAWRASEFVQVLDVLATGICLGMAAVSLAIPEWHLAAMRIRDAVAGGLDVVRNTAAGIIPVALRTDFRWRSSAAARYDIGAIVRAGAASLILLLVFGSLLLSADPIFASIVSLPHIDAGEIISHAFVIGFFTWIVAGWSRGMLRDDARPARIDKPFPVTLSVLDVSMTFGTLVVLFTAFVAAQLAWFFGGEAYLRAHTSLTASAYARRGFFELVWVALLVIPLLVASRAMLTTGAAVRRRHTALAIPLVALLAAMMVSAALRMRMYVHYYGLTEDRFYPLVFMAWLGVLLVWLTLTVLRDKGRPFLAGTAISGFATLALLNVASPDEIIARVNLGRDVSAANAVGLDLPHLARLSGDAVELSTAAVIADRRSPARDKCAAASRLLDSWGPASWRARESEGIAAWRRWNSGERRALEAVASQAAALRRVAHVACAEARATSRPATPEAGPPASPAARATDSR